MKKRVFVSMCVLFTALVSNAMTDDYPKLPVVPSDNNLVSTFYGAKASSNANNPCKGATIRVCGEVSINLVALTNDETFVSKSIKDADGKLKSVSTYILAEPLEEAKVHMKMETIRNGGTIKTKVEP